MHGLPMGPAATAMVVVMEGSLMARLAPLTNACTGTRTPSRRAAIPIVRLMVVVMVRWRDTGKPISAANGRASDNSSGIGTSTAGCDDPVARGHAGRYTHTPTYPHPHSYCCAS